MKKSFPGFYSPTQADLKILWKDALIVLDANVLLSLYRYSPATRTRLLALFRDLRPRLWLPYQAGQEFHENRLSVVSDQLRTYDSLSTDFKKILSTLDASRSHPFVSDSLRKKLAAAEVDLDKEIEGSKKHLIEFYSDDPVLSEITELFEGRVGSPFTSDQIEEILAEGEERYKRGIPPGFEDRKKPDRRRFGDLVLWKQILSHVAKDKPSVIFVTEDSKKDWWHEIDGKTIGPLPALREEMVKHSGNLFHMYRTDRFLQLAGEYLPKRVDEAVIQEVKDTILATDMFRKMSEKYARSLAVEKELKLAELEAERTRFLERSRALQSLDPSYLSQLNLSASHELERRLLEVELERGAAGFDASAQAEVKARDWLSKIWQNRTVIDGTENEARLAFEGRAKAAADLRRLLDQLGEQERARTDTKPKAQNAIKSEGAPGDGPSPHP